MSSRPSTVTEEIPAPRADEPPLRALVVDDEPRLRQVLVRLMQRDGYDAVDAANAEEAIALLERSEAALIVSDLRMPGMGGVELLRTVRTRWPDTAVVMISAANDVDVAVSCLAMGAMDYLTKPFHLDEVRARVKQALENRRLVLENRAYQQGLEVRVAEQGR